MNEGLRFRSAVARDNHEIRNVALTAARLIKSLYSRAVLGGYVGEGYLTSDKLTCKLKYFFVGLGKDLFLGLCRTHSRLDCVGYTASYSGRGNGRTGEELNRVNVFRADACEFIGIACHTSLTVRFGLVGYNNLGNGTVCLNANGHRDITCIALNGYGDDLALDLG